MSAAKRLALAAAAGLLAIALLAGLLGSESSGGTSDRPASAADAEPGGLSIWAELLALAGHEVERVQRAPGDFEPDPETTLILIDPGQLTAGDARSLDRFVDVGGRLVIGGEIDQEALELLAGGEVGELEARGPAGFAPLVPAPEVSGVGEVQGDGERLLSDGGPLLPLLGEPGAFSLLVATSGTGRLVLLADPSPLRNGRIVDADNARLGLAVAGPAERPVLYVERVATAPPEGLGALPGDWAWAFAGLLLAGAALVAARWRRLGSPEGPTRRLPPPRRAYVHAIAASLARARAPQEAAEPLRRAAHERLRRAGLPGADEPERLREAGRSLGLEPAEIEALLAPAHTERETVSAARALAKLTGGPRSEERR